MEKKLNLRVAIATTVFMMLSGLFSVNAQFLYMDSHVFVGQRPSNYASASKPETHKIIVKH
jgi:hypothetical protein